MVSELIWLAAGALLLRWICSFACLVWDLGVLCGWWLQNHSVSRKCMYCKCIMFFNSFQHFCFQPQIWAEATTIFASSFHGESTRIILAWWWILHTVSLTLLIWYHTGRIIIRMPFYSLPLGTGVLFKTGIFWGHTPWVSLIFVICRGWSVWFLSPFLVEHTPKDSTDSFYIYILYIYIYIGCEGPGPNWPCVHFASGFQVDFQHMKAVSQFSNIVLTDSNVKNNFERSH